MNDESNGKSRFTCFPEFWKEHTDWSKDLETPGWQQAEIGTDSDGTFLSTDIIDANLQANTDSTLKTADFGGF